MTGRKNAGVLIGLVLAVSLIASAVTAMFMAEFNNRMHFQFIGHLFRELTEEQPDMEQTVLNVLKEYSDTTAMQKEENVLLSYGYRQSDFFKTTHRYPYLFAAIGFSAGSILFLFTFRCRRKKEAARIKALTVYLENVNTGSPGLISETGEDDFSQLQDEIYKTVTMLYQTRDAALDARNKFAENLSNIAHQLKTPVTAISLTTQMMRSHPSGDYPEQIQKQLNRLVYLEEALLLLSRLDAGTLPLKQEAVDVYTVLTLAADNLQEVLTDADVSIDIPEGSKIEITADLGWTMETLMNLLKNCVEHTPAGGTVHCSYDKNPLYKTIIIRDEGEGFAGEDIPRLFERFYRGRNAGKNGIGIGLSLAKEIIELQNGTIRAKNIPGGGGCFEIRFYSH